MFAHRFPWPIDFVQRFHSLRFRLLVPVLAVALLASLAVAVGSYLLGDRWAREEVANRYSGIQSTLSNAAFPLNQAVIALIADLTNTQIVTLDAQDRVVHSSIDVARDAFGSQPAKPRLGAEQLITIDGQPFRYGQFERRAASNDDADSVVVLFDETQLRSSRLRAAGLPLVTGLSTVMLLTSVTLVLASRLIRRLSRLQQRVEGIADGQFRSEQSTDLMADGETGKDEVGLLSGAVSRMSEQLQRMWSTLQRQHGEKLLHQIAGGLAHQLRNSITGARMAVELHQRECQQTDDSMAVALSQLEQTEQHVQRLLLAAAGKQEDDHPQSIRACIEDVQTAVTTTANHLGVELNWVIDEPIGEGCVIDGPSFTSAVSNLLLNAIQEAKHVDIHFQRRSNGCLEILVVDDGPGPNAEVADSIFEPFVTSKPEGLGLGLPLVARSARRLGGSVEWERLNQRTQFKLIVRVNGNGDG